MGVGECFCVSGVVSVCSEGSMYRALSSPLVGIDLEEMKGFERKMLLEAAVALKEPNQEPVLTHHLATPMHVAAAKEYMDVLRSAHNAHMHKDIPS